MLLWRRQPIKSEELLIHVLGRCGRPLSGPLNKEASKLQVPLIWLVELESTSTCLRLVTAKLAEQVFQVIGYG